jgi:hypothetical protein
VWSVARGRERIVFAAGSGLEELPNGRKAELTFLKHALLAYDETE